MHSFKNLCKQNVCPGPESNCMTLTLMVFLKEFFENANFEKLLTKADDKKI